MAVVYYIGSGHFQYCNKLLMNMYRTSTPKTKYYDMKQIFTTVALLLSATMAWAAPLTPQQALQRAIGQEGPAKVRGVNATKTYHLVYEKKTAADASCYVFNAANGGGYLVVSANDITMPVLGYSDSGTFDVNNIPENMRWWLDQYDREINHAVAEGVKGGTRTATTRAMAAISPMIKTKWNQGEPYNNQCPVVEGKKCVTGCVATAMAQVMNYHKYPEYGKGTVTITLDNTTSETSLYLNNTKIDWANMLDTYTAGSYNQTQADAVAFLMKACGYSVNMSYSPVESGAISNNIGSALKLNFKYNSNISYEMRDYYTDEAWTNLIYNELANKRPVLYGGQGDAGGHQFVCDGYDGNGYFHINWGWGGSSDGYFQLQALNPASLGIGGGGGGFNYGQDAVIGVQPTTIPPVVKSTVTQQGSLAAMASGNEVTIEVMDGGWFNFNYNSITVNIGVIIESRNGTSRTEYVTSYPSETIQINRGFGSMQFDVPASLPNGEYKVTVATRSDGVWTPVKSIVTVPNYIYLTKTSSGVKVQSVADKELTIVSAEVSDRMYLGNYNKMKLTFKNNTDTPISTVYVPYLFLNNEQQYNGKSIQVSLDPGQSVTKDAYIEFTPANGDVKLSTSNYTLYFADMATGMINESYIKYNVKLFADPNASITAYDFTVNCKPATQKYNNYPLFTVNANDEINVGAKVTGKGTYFGKDVNLLIFPATGGYNVAAFYCEPIVTLTNGQSANVTAKVDPSFATSGSTYQGVCYTTVSGKLESVSDPFYIKFDTTSVDEILGEDGDFTLSVRDDVVKAYSPEGVKNIVAVSAEGMLRTLKTDNDGQNVTASIAELPAGVYVITATDNAGNAKRIKIMK